MKRTIIIAEAGVNHNGILDNAKRLIDIAVDAGADYVKFQTFKAEKVASSKAVKAAYQIKTSAETESQLEMLQRLELDDEAHRVLINYCKERGIQFLSTPFDLDSIDLLKELGINIGKIPSGEITNLPYLHKMAQSFEQLILSTGMSNMKEIGAALDIFKKAGAKMNKVTVLHCNTGYPTPMKDVNLKAMLTIGDAFNVNVGYSDHTLGIEVPIAAVALGACVIEKHFTIDKQMDGPDHMASLDPKELNEMIKAIRNIENAMGNGVKDPSESEIKNKAIARKSIVAKRRIEKGESFSDENLTMKRPGTGISPMQWNDIIGKIAKRRFDKDDLIIL
jgi:N-acetylneuraminate synthase